MVKHTQTIRQILPPISSEFKRINQLYKDRRQIWLLIIREYERLFNFYSPRNHQKIYGLLA